MKFLNNDIKNDGYLLPQECDFMQVSANSSVEVDCSPKLNDPFFSSFEGLLINAAKQSIWPKNVSMEDYAIYPDGSNNSPLRLNIAGLANLPGSTFNMDFEVAYEILVVAVNEDTLETYSGKMNRVGVTGQKPPGALPGVKELKIIQENEQLRTVYFNVDLVSNLNIPIIETTYSVYATLGEYKSNVLNIRTSIR